ncbi:MAG: TetR/AcrR family transcriptional regulator [Peptostreptococcaceae bacterium]
MKKQDILEGAYKSFVNFGYKGTTMEKVAKMANVGKGTIYNFFNTKEELLEEIVMTHLKELREVAESAEDANLTLEENLENILFGIFKFKKENQLIIKLIQEEKTLETKEVKNLLSKVEDEINGYIKEKIQLGIDKGELIECDVDITAFIIRKIYISLITDWEEHNRPFSKEELLELIKIYILTGIKKPVI